MVKRRDQELVRVSIEKCKFHGINVIQQVSNVASLLVSPSGNLTWTPLVHLTTVCGKYKKSKRKEHGKIWYWNAFPVSTVHIEASCLHLLLSVQEEYAKWNKSPVDGLITLQMLLLNMFAITTSGEDDVAPIKCIGHLIGDKWF